MDGWVKIHRKITEWEWYTDDSVFRVFLHLVIMANPKDVRWRGRTIKRGQLLTSLRRMAEELKLSIKPIRRALDILKSDGNITVESDRKIGTTITVVKYDEYQAVNPQNPKTAQTSKNTVDTKKGTKKGTQTEQKSKVVNDCVTDTSESGVLPNNTLRGTQKGTPSNTPGNTKQEYKEEYIPPPPTHIRTYARSDPSRLDDLLGNENVRYIIHQRTRMTDEEVRSYVKEFEAQMELDGKTWRSDGEMVNHFGSWLNIKQRILKRQENETYGQRAELERKRGIEQMLRDSAAAALARGDSDH